MISAETISSVAQKQDSPAKKPAAEQISFLIPAYNGLEFTRACLDSLQRTVDLTPHEVIVINDASTDGTRAFLSSLPASIRVIHNSERSGYAVSMNRGVSMARGEILCLLNNDLIFRPGWLEPMLEALECCENPGFIGNAQINPGTGYYDHLGVVFGDNGAPIHFGKHFFFRPFRNCSEWKAVTAACCLIKKSVFIAGGGFDESFRNGCEDVDLCLKLRQLGHRHYVTARSSVFHHVSSSEGRHDFNRDNERILLERWSKQIKKDLTPRDRRLFAINYVLRFLDRPWRFNGYKLLKAIFTLIKCGH